jgi:hypothetical protein
MTPADKIQVAADIIHDEMARRGSPVSPADCLAVARRLYEIFCGRVEVRSLPPGEVAQRMHERYEGMQHRERSPCNCDACTGTEAFGAMIMSNRRTQTVDDVKETFARIRKADAQVAMAKAMLKHGNLTIEARSYVIELLDSDWQLRAYGIRR